MDAQAPRDPGARRGRKDTPKHRGLTALRLVTLAACLAFALMLATAAPREAPRVGAIGSGCSYELDTWTGRLTIRPTDGVSGEMARVYSALPEDDLRHAVRSVSVERGVLAPADSSYLFCDLDAVEAAARRANEASRSLGVAFTGCTLPGAAEPLFTVPDGTYALGLGIHGEPGIERRAFKGLDDTVTQMFATLIEHGAYHRTLRLWNGATASWDEVNQEKQPLAKGDRVIALVNNLGSVPLSECYGVYHRLAQACAANGITIARSLVGSYCTSLDMQGVSITLLAVDDDTLALYDAPVHTPALNW